MAHEVNILRKGYFELRSLKVYENVNATCF